MILSVPKEESTRFSSAQFIPLVNIIILCILLFLTLKPSYLDFVISKNSDPQIVKYIRYICGTIVCLEIFNKLLSLFSLRKMNKKYIDLQLQVDNLLKIVNVNNEYINNMQEIKHTVSLLKLSLSKSQDDFAQSSIAFHKKSDVSQNNVDNMKNQLSEISNRLNIVYNFAQQLQEHCNANFNTLSIKYNSQQEIIKSLQSQSYSTLQFLNETINNLNDVIKIDINLPVYKTDLSLNSFSNIEIKEFNKNLNVLSDENSTADQTVIADFEKNDIEITALISNCQKLMEKLEKKSYSKIKASLSNCQTIDFDLKEETTQLLEVLRTMTGSEISIPETFDKTFIDNLQKYSNKIIPSDMSQKAYYLLQRLIEKKILFNLNKSVTKLSEANKIIFKNLLYKMISLKDQEIIKYREEIDEKLKEYTLTQAKGFSLEKYNSFLSFLKTRNEILDKLNNPLF